MSDEHVYYHKCGHCGNIAYVEKWVGGNITYEECMRPDLFHPVDGEAKQMGDGIILHQRPTRCPHCGSEFLLAKLEREEKEKKEALRKCLFGILAAVFLILFFLYFTGSL